MKVLKTANDKLRVIWSDLEKLLNNEDLQVPPLIRIDIAHYQFESIHPFLDGNGRLGRLQITLYLVSNKIIGKPALYLSDFFERNRSHYYDNLTAVRTQNNLVQWLKFFLAGVLETAENSIQTFHEIRKLRSEIEEKNYYAVQKSSACNETDPVFIHQAYRRCLRSGESTYCEHFNGKPVNSGL